MKNFLFFIWIALIPSLFVQSQCYDLNTSTNSINNDSYSLYSVIQGIADSYFVNTPQEFLYPENMLKDTALKNFRVNAHSDTIFIKKEVITTEIVNHDYYYLVAWNRKGEFVYISNRPFYSPSDSTLAQKIKKYKHEFLRMVEDWDTTALRNKETRLQASAYLPTYITRIIVKQGKTEFDTFKFRDLDIPYKNDDGEIQINTSYNPLYQFFDN